MAVVVAAKRDLYQMFDGWSRETGLVEGVYKDPDTSQAVSDKSGRYLVALPRREIDRLRRYLRKIGPVFKEYQTLKNEIYALASLPPDQREIFETVWNFYQQEPDWDKFSTFWLAQVDRLQPKLTRKEIVETPIFTILEDMDSRLAIKQN